MAHWAIVKENNIVANVIVISNDEILNENGEEDATLGYLKCKECMGEEHRDEWKYVQCSYNATIRGKFPGIGDTYDESLDAFIPAKPYDYMVFDQTTWSWVAPNKPETTQQMILDKVAYEWNHDIMKWELIPQETLDYSLIPEWETMTKEERMTHYYRWDGERYLQTGDYLSSYVKTEIPAELLPPEVVN